VRNRPDGSVEAVFEGQQQAVDAVLQWCHEGPNLAVVKNVEVKWLDFTGEFENKSPVVFKLLTRPPVVFCRDEILLHWWP
jgi:acylphosphatase